MWTSDYVVCLAKFIPQDRPMSHYWKSRNMLVWAHTPSPKHKVKKRSPVPTCAPPPHLHPPLSHMFYLSPALFSTGTVKSQTLASWPTLGATQAPHGAVLLHSESQHCFFLLHLPHLAPQPPMPTPFSAVITTHPRERPGNPFQVLPSWIFPQDKN